MSSDPLHPACGTRPATETLWMRRWRRFLPWGIGSFLVLGVLLCREEGMDCCAGCGSYRTLRSWGIGAGSDARPWLVVLPDEPIRTTLAMEDLFPADHRHEWRLTYHRCFGVGAILSPIICGGLYRNAFANAYEESSSLREFVLGEIRAGRASREDVLGMLHLSRNRPRWDSEEQRALRIRAGGWMREHAPGAPNYYMEGAGSVRDAAADYRGRAQADSPK